MINKITILFTSIFLLISFVFPIELNAITAEDRLIEVERQLQAIAAEISKYEGERTDLEKAIIANDKDLAQVNSELAEVQSRLATVQRELDKALEKYDVTLNDLVEVQENIVNEQIKLGKIKNEIIRDLTDTKYIIAPHNINSDEIERIVKRDKVSEEEAKIIIDKQMSRHDRISYATDFILNDSSIEDFERKLEFYFNFFESQL